MSFKSIVKSPYDIMPSRRLSTTENHSNPEIKYKLVCTCIQIQNEVLFRLSVKNIGDFKYSINYKNTKFFFKAKVVQQKELLKSLRLYFRFLNNAQRVHFNGIKIATLKLGWFV